MPDGSPANATGSTPSSAVEKTGRSYTGKLDPNPGGGSMSTGDHDFPPSRVTYSWSPAGPPAAQPSVSVVNRTGSPMGMASFAQVRPPSLVLKRSPMLK